MAEVTYLIPKRQRPTVLTLFDELDPERSSMVDIPLLGFVTAGQPIDMVENHDRVSVPASMVRKKSYALRVRGHSMIEDNIEDGDIIVIEKCDYAENGQSVVAMINNEKVTLKRFYIEKEGIRLQPANPEMQPIYLRNEEVQVLGIVTGVIRQPTH